MKNGKWLELGANPYRVHGGWGYPGVINKAILRGACLSLSLCHLSEVHPDKGDGLLLSPLHLCEQQFYDHSILHKTPNE